jgi:vesicle-associated membrane protein 2
MQQVMAQKRMAQQQAQVDDVVGIMRTNVEKVLERDQKLSELDERADALQNGASQFEKQAGKLKNKFWLQNMKWIVIGVLAILILVIFLYLNYSGENPELKTHQLSTPKPTQVISAPEEVLKTKDTEVPTQKPETVTKEAKETKKEED